MTNEEIKEIIEKHQHLLKEDCEGWEDMKADLCSADLCGAAIAELKDENAELKKKCEAEKSIGATFSKNGADLARWVEELRKEIESLKSSHYAEMVDAGMRERRLKRALWRAIALFCARSCEYFNGIMSHCLMGQDDLYKRCEEKKNKYLNAMYKCRKKMEMYK